MIEYLKHRDIEVIINSNGTLLTPNLAGGIGKEWFG
jgi:hypothetical protein